jgi:DNA adenine methylase
MANRSRNGFAVTFIKWAGGKGQILPEIRRAYPAGLGTTITKYAEPFVGGGAVLFDILYAKYYVNKFVSNLIINSKGGQKPRHI